MLPQGLAWQSLRQKTLAVVPHGMPMPYGSPKTLSDWLNTGSFSVSSATAKRIAVSASHVEIGAALLSEAAFYLDSAAEHSVSVRRQLAVGGWYSAAWLCVTFYYWAFYLVLSLTRMIGTTPVFLLPADLARLRVLSGQPGPFPGPGPFELSSVQAATVGHIDLGLKKPGASRVHDLVWRLAFDQIRDCAGLARGGGIRDEERLYVALETSANILGNTWPSDLRNLANYTPGAGYTAVRKARGVNAFGGLVVDPASDFSSGLSRLENNVSALSRGAGVAGDPITAAKVLIDLVFSLDVLVNELHVEVLTRRKIDRRWVNSRVQFLRQQFEGYGSPNWPYG